ncbi:MAG: hypothetical protein ABIJ74_00040 [archaeon]
MQKSLGIFVLLTVLVFLGSSVFGLVQSSNSLTWVTQNDTTITATFTATRCMNSSGTQELNVKVFKCPTGRADANATVTATVNEADGDTNSITFNNQGDGNYSFTYTFDANGTYKFQINAADSNISASYDLNDYIYVRDFSINVSFLNNNAEYSAGNTVTIRNYVINDDGNAFNDLNSSINVFYPDSSALHSNQEMTGIGNGEYIFSFVAPSSTGTYSATSTFSCGNESDSNSSGRFTVPAVSTPSGDTGGTGGGGGGGGSGSEKLKASIKDFSLEPLEVGVPASAWISFTNEMLRTKDFLVKIQILRGENLVFYSEETIPLVNARKTAEAFFSEKWVPETAGTHIVTVVLSSPDKMIKYDENVFRYDIAGEPRYDLEAICSDISATSGMPYDFNIVAYNLGDYYEDVELSWWIEDSRQQKIGFSSTPVAVFPGKSIKKTVSVFIPTNVVPGVYTAKVNLLFKEVERNAFCSFTLKSPKVYYGELLAELELEIAKLEEELKVKEGQGVVVDYIVEKLNKLKGKMILLKEKAGNYDYENLNEGITEVFAEINDLKNLTATVEREAAINLTEIIRMGAVVVGTIFLIYIINLLYKHLKTRKKKTPWIEKKIERLLGLEG